MLQKLGKYELIEIVGRGAMGEVYKAQDPLIGRMVALKTITSGLAGRADLLERFCQEARSAGTLQHPNIVTVYELGQEGETPFIAMEFLEGESLASLIERRPALSISQKLSYIIPVCRALNFAHKRGVVHRDIKPANVMITKEGRVKVVDFGIARLMDSSQTQTNTVMGTPSYMSPQQIRGERADERGDIWSTGVMLYELLTFQRPFEGDTPTAVMLNIAKDDVLPAPIRVRVPDCGPALEALVSKMMAKDIQQRYQNMEHALLAFEPILKKFEQGTTATRTIVAGEDVVRTRSGGASTMRSAGKAEPTIAATRVTARAVTAKGAAATVVQTNASEAGQEGPEASFAGASPLAEMLKRHKRPVVAGLSAIVLLGILTLVFKSRQSAADEAVAPTAAASMETSSAAGVGGDAAGSGPAQNLPFAPGVIATAEELAAPWASKEFVFRNETTRESVPAMVVHLPRGGYWGFSLIEPYGRCHLEYVTELQKLADTYGYRADHPLIADPCSHTLFDLMRYGGPTNAEVRGDIVRGPGLRPPIAIEIEQRGSSIVAVRMEE